MPIIVDPLTGADASGDVAVTALLGGLIFGDFDENGVEYRLYDMPGWSGPPDSTGSVSQRAASDGAWPSPVFTAARFFELRVQLIGRGYEAVSAAIDQISAAMPLRDLAPIVVVEGERSRQAIVRQDGKVLIDRSEHPWRANLSIPLVAPDPLRYGLAQHTETTGLPSTSGGLTLPLTLPLSIGATVTSGRVAVTNEGNAGTPPLLILAGPVPAGARLTLVSTGESLFVRDAVPAGRTLVLDAANQTAVLDGTASRLVTGVWFRLPPGEDEVAFAAPTYDPDARLIVQWQDAYL